MPRPVTLGIHQLSHCLTCYRQHGWNAWEFAGRLRVTDSLPIPRRTGVLSANENITSGALSLSDRPFHTAKPNTDGVPT